MNTDLTTQSPWVSGPSEILQFALSLIEDDNDVNRRIAIILIDNAVELMIKTYLTLPKRAVSFNLSRNEYQKHSGSFPQLLDLLEKYANEKLDGIDLAEIEWYHRLRNELYHQGLGLTAKKHSVEVYAELAKLLFKNLFEIDLPIEKYVLEGKLMLLGEFMEHWAEFERILMEIDSITSEDATKPLYNLPWNAIRKIGQLDLVDQATSKEIRKIRAIRNSIVHGEMDHKELLTPEINEQLKTIKENVSKKLLELKKES